MKKTIIAILMLGLVYTSYSQKAVLAIKILRSKAGGQQNKYSEAEAKIEDLVTNKIVNTKKVRVVDRSIMGEFKVEELLTSDGSFMGGETSDLQKKIGAGYLLGILINTLDLTQDNSGGMTTYKCKINFTTNVYDIATGETILTESFGGCGGCGLINLNKDLTKVIDKALDEAGKSVDAFVGTLISNPNFSLKASVANIEEKDTTGAATKILISAGSSQDVKVGSKFKITETTILNVDGKRLPRKKEIGTVEVTAIEDENFSVCKVITGGADIAKKKEDNKKLQAVIINN